MANSNKSKKEGGYTRKAKQGLVPFKYERTSARYAQGAWKNWSPDEQRRLAFLNDRGRVA